MFATEIVPTILNRKPDGNTSVECFESIGSPGDFLLVETWESEQAFDTRQRHGRVLGSCVRSPESTSVS
jgi:quinol monooxygenase YgiN